MPAERILVVDDEPDICALVSDILTDEGYQVNAAETADMARQQVQANDYDCVLLDIWMPGEDGITLLKDWKEQRTLHCPIIMMSGHGTVETAVEATRLGAFSFVEKPLTTAKLISTIRTALDVHQQVKPLNVQNHEQPVGNSALMQRLLEVCARSARTNDHLIAVGEEGTGRQTILRYIHNLSERHSAAFILMDMSPLFATNLNDDDWSKFNTGFVDAIKQAQGGTICMPDIHNIDMTLQKRVCELLKQLVALKMFERFNVRFCSSVISSRENDYLPELKKIFALTVLHVPALRDHTEDIPELVNHLIDTFSAHENYPYSKCSIAAQNALLHYQWPGNISELKLIIKQLLLTTSEGEISVDDVASILPPANDQLGQANANIEHMYELPLREAREMFEKEYLQYQLEKVNGSVSKLADRVGMERTHLYRKLRALGIGAKDST
ncbi:MAG: hypothetical protein CBC79_04150 [Gammaproteobacteria bacterium TMED119]|nr:MAG: hypothetical protein CBC79_04150 [Gammaproteobacteria bacterium TMED119]|tara:strand:+ start:330 stop:1652 length:1323 start_codon:yes stop_codon:yes gene_type:complete